MQQAQTARRLLQTCDAAQHKSVSLSLWEREVLPKRFIEREATACTRLVFRNVGVTLSMLRENVCGVQVTSHQWTISKTQ